MTPEPFALGTFFSGALGKLLYYVLTLVTVEAGWGMCLAEWWQRRKRDYLYILLAFSVVLASRGLALAADLLGWRNGPPAGVTAASLAVIDTAAIICLCWAFQAALLSAAWSRLYLGANLAAAGLFHIALSVTALAASGALRLPPAAERAWLIWQGMLCALTVLLIARRLNAETLAQALAFLSLAAGRLALGIFGVAGADRLGDLLAFPLLAISLYQSITSELTSMATEFQAISEPASRRTRQLMFSLESARFAVSTLDLATLLPGLTENVALALNADGCVIFLAEEPDKALPPVPIPDSLPPEAAEMLQQMMAPPPLRVAAVYDPLGSKAMLASRPIPLEEMPAASQVMRERRQMHITAQDHPEQVAQLTPLFGRVQLGDVLLQPLTLREDLIGMVVVANRLEKPAFGVVEAKLCEGMAGQIASAISNARMYENLQRQARQLANLLEVQQIETSQTKAILESIADGVVVCDVTRHITLINQAAATLLGISQDALLGQPIAELERRLGSPLVAGGGAGKSEFQSIPLGEEGRVLRGSVAPVLSQQGRHIGNVTVFRDVTSELKAEEAKSNFLATVSHELRTPLTSIKGYSELLSGGMAGDLPSSIRRFLRMIAANADRMAYLVDNILYVSEAERGVIPIHPRATDVSAILREAVEAAGPSFSERNLACELQVEDNLPELMADPQRLRQVLDNLLQNAWKFTPAGGHVWVRAERCRILSANGGSRGLEEEFVLISVRDTGVGIPPEDHERVFERFYRSPNPLSVEAGGTGIGLTIVKSLVEAHGGRVWVDSAVNAGSTFHVLLPARRAAAGAPAQSQAA